MWNTFEIALLVTLFCLLLGYPLGFLIATTTPTWATLGFIFVPPRTTSRGYRKP
jgi:ABC-type spermidine/putrescine transport system permease subunit I